MKVSSPVFSTLKKTSPACDISPSSGRKGASNFIRSSTSVAFGWRTIASTLRSQKFTSCMPVPPGSTPGITVLIAVSVIMYEPATAIPIHFRICRNESYTIYEALHILICTGSQSHGRTNAFPDNVLCRSVRPRALGLQLPPPRRLTLVSRAAPECLDFRRLPVAVCPCKEWRASGSFTDVHAEGLLKSISCLVPCQDRVRPCRRNADRGRGDRLG